jgi:hypothetical protein
LGSLAWLKWLIQVCRRFRKPSLKLRGNNSMGRMKEFSIMMQEVQEHLDCISSLELEALVRNIEMVLQERALDAEFEYLQNGEKVLDSEADFTYN